MSKSLKFAAMLLLAAFVSITAHAQAQSSLIGAARSPEITTELSRTQIVNSLANMPEADMLVYANPQRILNEMLPKLMTPKDLAEMRQGFEQAQKMVGVDPAKIDYIVIAVRFRKPTANLDFQPPEFLAMASGDFSSDSLIVLARAASQGKLRDEKYSTRTLGLITIDPLVKMGEQNPFLKSFSEVGIVALTPNTIAVGTPGYLRAAVDAGEGKGRISTETLNSLVRDPNALISVAGGPWQAFAKSFGMLGTETTSRDPRCLSKMGEFYLALTMDATNFMLRGASNADNPDTAKIISKLYSGMLGYAAQSVPDMDAQRILKSIAITAEGDEVHVSADISQQSVLDLIQKQSKKPEVITAPQKEPVKTRKTTRRRRRGA